MSFERHRSSPLVYGVCMRISSPIDVAVFLSGLFPELREIEHGILSEVGDEDDLRDTPEMKQWQQVNELLPLFARVRKEERRRLEVVVKSARPDNS